jgi:hypothetical protein
MRHDGMVFGVGLSKTGTHSLTGALELLGIPTVHYPSPALMNEGRYEAAFEGCRGATDISVSAYFRQLDRAYPGSRFILTLRDVDAWLNSVEDHRRRRAHEDVTTCPKAVIREIVYGIRGFDRGVFRAAYHEWNDTVRRHFAARPDDLLQIDLTSGEGWETLCPFLGVEIPAQPIPHRNARAGTGV